MSDNGTTGTLSDHIAQNQFMDFYICRIREEISGRPVGGVPIKIMGADPRTLGTQAAKLVASRYCELRFDSIEAMPRTGLVTLQLRASYLAITFERPEVADPPKRRSAVFSRFLDNFSQQLTKEHDPKVRGSSPSKVPFWQK
jgi:hypothetical protein